MYKLLHFISPPLGLGKKCPSRVAYKVCPPPQSFCFLRDCDAFRLSVSLLIHWGAREWPEHTCIQMLIDPPLTSRQVTMASAGNNAACQPQTEGIRCHVQDIFLLLNTGVKEEWRREHCVLCFHFGYCCCLLACRKRVHVKGILHWTSRFWFISTNLRGETEKF